MKPGSVKQIRMLSQDYRYLLDIMDLAGIHTNASHERDMLGLALSTFLEVLRKAPKQGEHSVMMQSFITETQRLMAAWDVSGGTPQASIQQGFVPPETPPETWSTEDLLAECERLSQYVETHPVCKEKRNKLLVILKDRVRLAT
jgi:hypothetical protein